MSKVVENAAYADSLGLTGPAAEIVARNKLFVEQKMMDGTGESKAAIFYEYIPSFRQLLNFSMLKFPHRRGGL